MVTLDVIEFESKNAFSDFSKIRSERSRLNSSVMTTSGNNNTSLITNLPSTFSKIPFEPHLKLRNSNFEYSTIAKNVALNNCSLQL